MTALTKKGTKVRRNRADVIFDTIVYAVLIVLLVIVIYPLWFVIIASVSNPTDVTFGKVIPFSELGFEKAGRAEYQRAAEYIFSKVCELKFGEGNVVSVTGSGAQARIKIEFTAYGEKEFALSVAPIVKLED